MRSRVAGYSQAQNKATQKYVKENYDRIQITCRKGKKEQYKALAEGAGKSLNQYILDLLEAEFGEK